MKCFKCKNTIHEEDDYIIMTNIKDKKEVHKDYIHRLCWDDFCNKLNSASSSLNKSNYLLNAMGSHMRKIGIIPDAEVVI